MYTNRCLKHVAKGACRKTIISAFALTMMIMPPFMGSSNAANRAQAIPTIKLFPTTVKENMRQSKNDAKEMERNLETVIANMEKKSALFKASKCDGAEPDPGCAEQLKQLGEDYIKLAGKIETFLPKIQQSIDHTKRSLHKSIRKEMGRRSVWAIQESVMANTQKPKETRTSSRRGMGMAARFSRLLKLMELRKGQSMEVLAAEIYLDLKDTSQIINQTQLHIANARNQLELGVDLIITDEMMATVDGVKTLLFGEDDADDIAMERTVTADVAGNSGKFLR